MKLQLGIIFQGMSSTLGRQGALTMAYSQFIKDTTDMSHSAGIYFNSEK